MMTETLGGGRGASRRRIAAAAIGAVAAGAFLLVAVLLPAEYGIDPLGSGQALGLTARALSGVIAAQPGKYREDAKQFVLAPYESLEYKYTLEQGASMLYSWEATGPVFADFHSEPRGAPAGYAESFERQESPAAHGTYTAPFSGIHGWFWENRGRTDLTIRLRTAGFFTAAQEFRDGDSVMHPLAELVQ